MLNLKFPIGAEAAASALFIFSRVLYRQTWFFPKPVCLPAASYFCPDRSEKVSCAYRTDLSQAVWRSSRTWQSRDQIYPSGAAIRPKQGPRHRVWIPDAGGVLWERTGLFPGGVSSWKCAPENTGSGQLKHTVVELVVLSSLPQQLFMAAPLHHPAMLQHQNHIRIAHRGQAVGNDKDGAALH